MVCVMPPAAADSDDTVSCALAWPVPETARLRVPSVVPVVVSTNVTVPVGDAVLGALAVIVAVNVTGSPNTVGLFDVLKLADVVPWLTVSVVVPLEAPKSTLALNAAVIMKLPIGRPLNVSAALPLASSDLVPIGVTC